MKKLFLIAMCLASLSFIQAQVNFSGYMVDEENKNMKDVTINLYEENNLISTVSWAKKILIRFKIAEILYLRVG
ncbi:MAG: hypothetical protein KDD24_04540 [Flavobacteriales bacterium]|nr:hypothetical protein [Flavobacteriales bacterium]